MANIPAYKLTYNGKDITVQIEEDLIYVVYLDRTDSECDDLEIVLDDTHTRWSNGWYPQKGAKLNLQLGYKDKMVPAGDFEIDTVEMEYSNQGRQIRIKALSAMVTEPLRTKKSYTYRNTTLSRLAATVASRGHMTVSGKIEAVNIDYVAQYKETDLGFLHKIAGMYGYVFNIKSGKLVFTKMVELQQRNSVLELGPPQLKTIRISDSTGRTFQIAEQKYYDASKGQVRQFEAKAKVGKDKFSESSFTQNQQQAEIKAKASLAKIITNQVRASFTSWIGQPGLLAGNTIRLVKLGVLSGVYSIEASTHTMTKGGGYTTSVEAYKTGDVNSDKQ